MSLSPGLLAFLRGELDVQKKVREPSAAAKRDPHYPRQPLTARRLTLSEDTRQRGGSKSRRRTARVWS